MKDHIIDQVTIYKNDGHRTHVQTIKASLRPAQAEKIRQDLNAAFASQGIPWFAEAHPEDEG